LLPRGLQQIRGKVIPLRHCRASAGISLLTTSAGRAVTDRSFPGKWLLLYFGYTFCPDACPTALNALTTALDELGPLAARVQPIFIMVDPARDTSDVVADYVKAFDSRMVGLSGTPEQIAAAARNSAFTMRPAPWVRTVRDRAQLFHLRHQSSRPGHRTADRQSAGSIHGRRVASLDGLNFVMVSRRSLGVLVAAALIVAALGASFIKSALTDRLAPSQAMLNPRRAGMPRQASSQERMLPPTCNVLLRQPPRTPDLYP
jgi:SCO1/SenC